MDPAFVLDVMTMTASDEEAGFIDRNRVELERRIGKLIEVPEGCAVCAPCPAYCGTDRGEEETWPNGTKLIRGNDTVVFYPRAGREGGKGGLGVLDAYYALVPEANVIQSHDPFSFREVAAYPRDLQERAYDRDQLEQVKVIRQAETFKPAFAINTNPDAVNGPPIIDDQGYVLGGNSRTMAIKRVLAEGVDNAYTKALGTDLAECGGVYGLAQSPTSGTILVRVITSDYDPTSISRDLNRALTQNLDLAAQAVSLGRMLPSAVFETIGQAMFGDKDLTLMAALNRRAGEIIKLLQDAKVITQQNFGDFVRKQKGKVTNQLSASGRHMIRLAIVGALVGDKEWMALITHRQEKLYEYIAPGLMTLDAEDPENLKGFNLVPALRPGIGLLVHLGSQSVAAFERHFMEGELSFEKVEGEGVTLEQRFPEVYTNPLTAILTKWLVEAQQTPRIAYEAVGAYVNGTPGRAQVMMFGEDAKPEPLRVQTLGSRFPAAAVTVAEVERVGIRKWLQGFKPSSGGELFGRVPNPGPDKTVINELLRRARLGDPRAREAFVRWRINV